MRKIINITTGVLILFFLLSVTFIAQGQPQPPGGDPTGSNPPVGGSAAIGDGLGILLLLAVSYAAYRLVQVYRKLRTINGD